MTPIDRNPDINLDREQLPESMRMIYGKNLMHTARANRIPFGIATKREPCCNSSRMNTVGIVVRHEHYDAMVDALARKAARLARGKSLACSE